ncbi:hypothetical protein F5H01DRAFT_360379 [Linnemannia elongata]|nr:hypothetical protein F5H01DRAFT_360379 [Linnemannia elongata]
MTALISPRSQESSLSHQQQQQQLCQQTEGPRIQAPASPSSTQPNRTSTRPVAPSLKYLQQLNPSIRAETDLIPPISESFSSSSYSSLPSTSLPSSSASSPSLLSPMGPAVGGRVSAAITSLYQTSASASDSSPVLRNNINTHLARMGGSNGGQSSRLHVPSVFTSNYHIQGSRTDQGFAENTLSSFSNLISQPQPQHQQHQPQKQQKQTIPLVETTRSIPTPPQPMTLATTAPLDSAAPSSSSPCFSSSLSSSFVAPPPTSTLSSSNSLAPVPSPITPVMPITPENKTAFAPVVSTITREEEMQQMEQKQKQTQEEQQLDDKKEEEKGEEAKKEVEVYEHGNIKGENENKEFSNNTTTAMSPTNTTKAKTTTTITSSCDSTSTSASMPAATTIPATTNAGQQVHTGCVIPPVGRDNVRYGSLDAAAMSDEGTLLSMSLSDTTTKLRPMSSMEYAECKLADK